MNSCNEDVFVEMWTTAWELAGRNITARAVAAAYELLKQYPTKYIERALAIYQQQSKQPPAPSDIIEIIGSRTGGAHVGVDEAWSIALKMRDEKNTVIVTDEIMQAWAVAADVMELGDEVGARMAFKSAYNRMDKTTPPKWRPSFGHDPESRHAAVAEAVRIGRLPDSALESAPALEANPQHLVSGLIGYQPDSEKGIEAKKQALAAIKGMLKIEPKKREQPTSLVGVGWPLISDELAHKSDKGFAEMA